MDASETQAAPDAVTRLEVETDFPPGDVAAYLVETPAPIVIDAVADDEESREAVCEQLRAAGYEPADVAAAVLTHAHIDHVGQLPLFREAGVPVYAPQPAIERLQQPVEERAAGVREVGRSIGLDEDEIEREVEQVCGLLREIRRLVGPDSAVGYDLEGSFSVAGRTFEAVHAPGHQIHQAALATTVGGERALFSGDALLEPFKPATLHVRVGHGAYEAIDAYYEGMDRLADREFDRVYPGHGPVFTDAAASIAHTRSRLDDAVDGTLSALAAVEPATPRAVAEERVGEIDHPAMLLDTVGALGTLERRGEATYEERDGVRFYSVA